MFTTRTLLHRSTPRLTATCLKAVTSHLSIYPVHAFEPRRHKHSTSEATMFSLENEINAAFSNVEAEDTAAQTQGTVIETRENIACVTGLEAATMGALVRFQRNGSLGKVMNLERQIVRVAPLQNKFGVRRGEVVELVPAGRLTVEANKELVSLLTTALPNTPTGELNLHARTPPMLDWAKNLLPWVTGLMSVDVSFPLQLGQRVGIVGPSNSGKRKLASFLALSCLKGKTELSSSDATRPSHVVWVSLGKDTSAHVVAALGSTDVSDKFDFVHADHNSTPVMQYLSPHVGVALAEIKRAAGEHVLLVIDNVSAHGGAYEAMSRASVPDGHGTKKISSTSQPLAGVLSRCGPFKQSNGGGSITCLAILDTDDSEASLRNQDLLSITADATIPMSPELANRRMFPAIDCAKRGMQSLGARQNPSLRTAANSLRDLLWNVRGKAMIAGVQAKFGILPEYDLDTQFAVEMDAKLKTLFAQQSVGLNVKSYSLAQELVLITLAADGQLEHVRETQVTEYCEWILKQMGEKRVAEGKDVNMLDALEENMNAWKGALPATIQKDLRNALREETKLFLQQHR